MPGPRPKIDDAKLGIASENVGEFLLGWNDRRHLLELNREGKTRLPTNVIESTPRPAPRCRWRRDDWADEPHLLARCEMTEEAIV